MPWAPRACDTSRGLLQCTYRRPLAPPPVELAMQVFLRSSLVLVLALLGSCGSGDDGSELDGSWTWEGDGGCEGAGERILVRDGRITWTGAEGQTLGTSTVFVETSFDESDRLQRWVTMDYTRDARRIEDRFVVTDRLGTPVFRLEMRRVNDVFEDEFPHRKDRLVPCDG